MGMTRRQYYGTLFYLRSVNKLSGVSRTWGRARNLVQAKHGNLLVDRSDEDHGK